MTNNNIALVTGGSSGIGGEIAVELAGKGIKVFINFSKSKSKANKIKQVINQSGGEAFIYKADMTKEREVKQMFNYILNEFGHLDFLINCAGIYSPGLIKNICSKDWQNIIDLNLTAKFYATKYSIPLLKKSKNPQIINIASRSGVKPDEESGAYCCAAAAIIMLTKVSALELSKYHIRVNTISPGLTKTPLTEKFCNKKEFKDYSENNPSGRLGTTVDIARIVSFLVSEDTGFINGENINVSGGILLK